MDKHNSRYTDRQRARMQRVETEDTSKPNDGLILALAVIIAFNLVWLLPLAARLVMGGG